MKNNFLFLSILLLIILFGCTETNDHIPTADDVSEIVVYTFTEDKLVDTIKDEEFIQKLLKELTNAETASTANMDFELPDYKLVFQSSEDEEIIEISYFKEVMNLGVKGRYWDHNADLMYRVDLELPIE